MTTVKVAAAVLNQLPLDWDGNLQRILGAIETAREDGVQVLCLPEMCIPGYGCEDAYFSPSMHDLSWQMLQEILPATHGMVVSLGLPLLYRNALFNVACLAVDGFAAGFVAKRHLAGDGIHYEPRWFKAWPSGLHTTFTRGDRDYPLGDLHFDVGGLKIGFEICEDAWVANRPGANLASRAVDIILNPSASHFAFGKIEIRRRFVLEGSRAFGSTYVYSNLLGNEAGRAIYDGGAIIASGGKLLANGPRLTFQDFMVTSAVVDVEVTRMNQSRLASFKPDLETRVADCIYLDYTWKRPAPGVSPAMAEWESSPHIKEEEFTRAEALALFDYLRKSHSRGFVISLSGGADSAAVACLVSRMVSFGLADLGWEGFVQRLSHIPLLKNARSERELVATLLTTVYQGTQNSSETTRSAAETVAKAVGSTHYEWSIDAMVGGYRGLVEHAIGRELTWAGDDISLQNIQARVRAPGVWMLANLRGALLLATSNRSEAAVGYATMDGDTCGGLSPIAGIDKAWLRKWLVWMEKTGPVGDRSIPELVVINVQAPTAELRPTDRHQTDEDDLMPYEILDGVERLSIRDKKSPTEVYLVMCERYPDISRTQMLLWVERFFTLWYRNQWKRERYAPSFHLDDENLDPKTWCRFPILSAGYHRELAELRGVAASEG